MSLCCKAEWTKHGTCSPRKPVPIPRRWTCTKSWMTWWRRCPCPVYVQSGFFPCSSIGKRDKRDDSISPVCFISAVAPVTSQFVDHYSISVLILYNNNIFVLELPKRPNHTGKNLLGDKPTQKDNFCSRICYPVVWNSSCWELFSCTEYLLKTLPAKFPSAAVISLWRKNCSCIMVIFHGMLLRSFVLFSWVKTLQMQL